MAASAAIQRAAQARVGRSGTAAGPEGDSTAEARGRTQMDRNNAFGPRPRIAPGRNGPLYGRGSVNRG